IRVPKPACSSPVAVYSAYEKATFRFGPAHARQESMPAFPEAITCHDFPGVKQTCCIAKTDFWHFLPVKAV
ncbi:hypothetical protein, partial [Agrobacterium pusense]|uniref:hypothetical protein n=1 Tax=Agrobacterium pusense TaxID=648995 RepID=UPI00289C635E